MDRITLHRAVADNAGQFCDAGSTLAVGDATEPRTITADRAQELVDATGAVDAGEAAVIPPPPPLELDQPIDDDGHAG